MKTCSIQLSALAFFSLEHNPWRQTNGHLKRSLVGSLSHNHDSRRDHCPSLSASSRHIQLFDRIKQAAKNIHELRVKMPAGLFTEIFP